MTGESGTTRPSYRILMVVGRFPRPTETFVVGKFKALIDAGQDVRLLCSRFDREVARRLYPELLSPSLIGRVVERPREGALTVPLLRALRELVLSSPRLIITYVKRGRSTVGLAATIRRLYVDSVVLRWRPDVVHFEFPSAALGHIHVGHLTGTTVVVSFRGSDAVVRGLDEPGYYSEIWKFADAVCVRSPSLLQRLAEREMPGTVVSAVIPPGIEIETWPRAVCPTESITIGIPEQPLRLLSVGRLTQAKGHDGALRAVARLRQGGVDLRYVIIGEGELRPYVEDLIKNLDLGDVVELKGHLNQERVRQEMARSHLLLHPSRWEGFGGAIVEAQLSGLPVVASDVVGCSDAIEHGRTGWLVPSGDDEGLASLVRALIDDPAHRREVANAARIYAVDERTLTGETRSYIELYSRLQDAGAES